ncbi:MAG: hypothetical protein KDC35_05735 [Acidobacteria bacterium]|nr:hypothetical protein [Acidobacteriota bacterium]
MRFALFMLLTLLPSCTRTDPDRTVRIGLMRDVDSLNPYTSTSVEGEIVAGLLFPRLFEEQPGQGNAPELRPFLVTVYHWDDTQKILTLDLDPTRQWHDGNPITSKDVSYSLKVQMSPEVPWISADTKANIADWQIIDPQHLTVRFHRAKRTNLLDLNEGFMIPEHVFSVHPFGNWLEVNWAQHLVGGGPYQLKGYEPNQFLRVTPYGFSGPDLVFTFARDRETQYMWLESGLIDYSWSLPPHRMQTLPPPLVPKPFPNHQFAYLVWNPIDSSDLDIKDQSSLNEHLKSHPHRLFSDPQIRVAIEFLLARDAYIQQLWGNLAQLPATPWSVGMSFHKTAILPRNHDPNKGIRMLETKGYLVNPETGIRENLSGPLVFSVLCNTGSQIREDYLSLIQRDLRQYGVRMDIELVEPSLYWSRCAAKQFDAAFVMFRRENRPDLAELFHSRHALGDDGFNYSSWSSADPWLDRLEWATDEAELDTCLEHIESLFYEEAPVTLLYETLQAAATSPLLEALKPNYLDPLSGIENIEFIP